MKNFILFLLFSVSLFGSNVDIEKKIYKTIIYSIFPQKQTIKIWSDDPKKKLFLGSIKKTHLVQDPQKADILIISKPLKELPKKVLFATNYAVLRKYQNNIVGGFYWQKGRPNIIFIDHNLKKFDIELPESMQEFIEDEL